MTVIPPENETIDLSEYDFDPVLPCEALCHKGLGSTEDAKYIIHIVHDTCCGVQDKMLTCQVCLDWAMGLTVAGTCVKCNAHLPPYRELIKDVTPL